MIVFTKGDLVRVVRVRPGLGAGVGSLAIVAEANSVEVSVIWTKVVPVDGRRNPCTIGCYADQF